MIRQRIVFRGRVQGVGFRYRERMAATQIGVTGWVRNNPDGTVTMEIQGTEEQIDSVIIAIERSKFIQIDSMDVKSLPLIEKEQDFQPVRSYYGF
jgi:acylphosphatase